MSKDWICPKCGEVMPGTFDSCWNCGYEQLNLGAPPGNGPLTTAEKEAAVGLRPANCRACGSAKLMPGVTVADQGQYSSGHLQVEIQGKPDAILFKDRQFGKLRADICGSCGYTELYVENPAELYEHFEEARRRARQGEEDV